MKNGIAQQEILAPIGFDWKDEDGYSLPDYRY
jgi:hypothetical protein